MPEFPGGSRLGIYPKSLASSSGGPFCLGVGLSINQGLLSLICFVMPCKPEINLSQATVDAIDRELADGSPVTVELLPFNVDLFAESAIGHRLLGCLSEGLGLLRRVDPFDAYLDLAAFACEQGHCVAVRYANDLAFERVGRSEGGREDGGSG